MSIFHQNPFLAGFGAAMVVGVGALGYLGYSAMSENTQARTKYEEAVIDLKNLQGNQIYPNDENLKKVKELKQSLQAKVMGFQKDLSTTKIKVEPISSAAFQDKLKETVNSIAERSVESKVKFPGNEKEQEKFYLGFDAYKSTQPKPEAAPLLLRQLKAIEVVINQLLETKNAQVVELIRTEVNLEKEAKPVAVDPKLKNKQPNEAGKSLVDRQSFSIRFVTSQSNFQRIFNGIVGNKQQLFIVRTVAIHNQSQEPPSKAAVAQAGALPPPTPASPATPPVAPAAVAPGAPAEAPVATEKKTEFIFGKELIEAHLQIDIVDVQEPAAAPVEKAAAKK